MLTIGSLFSGIAGLDLGLLDALAALGVAAQVAWQAEINPYARAGDGAPHLRRRMFVLAHANLHRCEGWRCGGTRASVDAAARGGTLPDADGGGRGRGAGLGGEQTGRPESPHSGQWPTEPRVGRVVDGVSSRMDSRRRRARLAVLGAAVVRPTAARAFLTLAARAGLTEGTAHG